MNRQYYFDLAASGKRIPVATHLVLHEKADPEKIINDGKRLAEVIAETANRFDCPLALPLMDLTLEKEFMLGAMGIKTGDMSRYFFESIPSVEQVQALRGADIRNHTRIKAECDALSELSKTTDLVPVGMVIGPFSMLTQMFQDPIVPIYMAGTGISPEESEEIALLHAILALCEIVVEKSCRAQIQAGAKAMFVCEPAANLAYFSPNQMEEGSTVFHDFVIRPNLAVKKLLDSLGADLMFHDCGQLTAAMVESFAVLEPVLISLGSPVALHEVEPYIPKTTVIYGNLPTKKFYSDEEIPLDAIPGMVEDLEIKLRATGHPFIIGSECDILSVSGYETKIMEKVDKFCSCRAEPMSRP